MIEKHTHEQWIVYVENNETEEIVHTLETMEDLIYEIERNFDKKEKVAAQETLELLSAAGVSNRVRYALCRQGVCSIKHLAEMVEDESIFYIRNIGKKSLLEIANYLENVGYIDSAEKIRNKKMRR